MVRNPLLSLIGFALLLFGCGGGGGSSTPAAPPGSPAITTQPVDYSAAIGATATFTVVATGTAPLTYQWQTSPDGATWTNVAGATTATCVLTNRQLTDDGLLIHCVVTNAIGTVTSNQATLHVTAPTAPVITDQPATVMVMVGDTATFTVVVSGTMPLTYRWDVSADLGTTWTPISGANAATYNWLNVQLTDQSKQVRCYVSNAQGNATSAAAMVMVNTTG